MSLVQVAVSVLQTRTRSSKQHAPPPPPHALATHVLTPRVPATHVLTPHVPATHMLTFHVPATSQCDGELSAESAAHSSAQPGRRVLTPLQPEMGRKECTGSSGWGQGVLGAGVGGRVHGGAGRGWGKVYGGEKVYGEVCRHTTSKRSNYSRNGWVLR